MSDLNDATSLKHKAISVAGVWMATNDITDRLGYRKEHLAKLVHDFAVKYAERRTAELEAEVKRLKGSEYGVGYVRGARDESAESAKLSGALADRVAELEQQLKRVMAVTDSALDLATSFEKPNEWVAGVSYLARAVNRAIARVTTEVEGGERG